MFELEEVLGLFSDDVFIRLVDQNDQPLFTASTASIIPMKYRHIMVNSIQRCYGHVTIKLNCLCTQVGV